MKKAILAAMVLAFGASLSRADNLEKAAASSNLSLQNATASSEAFFASAMPRPGAAMSPDFAARPGSAGLPPDLCDGSLAEPGGRLWALNPYWALVRQSAQDMIAEINGGASAGEIKAELGEQQRRDPKRYGDMIQAIAYFVCVPAS